MSAELTLDPPLSTGIRDWFEGVGDKLQLLMMAREKYAKLMEAVKAKNYAQIGLTLDEVLDALKVVDIGDHVAAVMNGVHLAVYSKNYRYLGQQILTHVLTPLLQFLPDGTEQTPVDNVVLPEIRIGVISGASGPIELEDKLSISLASLDAMIAAEQVSRSVVSAADPASPASPPVKLIGGFTLQDLTMVIQLITTLIETALMHWRTRPKTA